MAVKSLDAEAKERPLCENCTNQTSLSCASSTCEFWCNHWTNTQTLLGLIFIFQLPPKLRIRGPYTTLLVSLPYPKYLRLPNIQGNTYCVLHLKIAKQPSCSSTGWRYTFTQPWTISLIRSLVNGHLPEECGLEFGHDCSDGLSKEKVSGLQSYGKDNCCVAPQEPAPPNTQADFLES